MAGTATRLRLTYPEALPITAQREVVLDAIRDHQVVVVAGETGSGKSTQLPKFCLELGRGTEQLIGHTQPRRLAARTVAARIAEELGTEIGDLVGYKVRFSDQVGDQTMVKLMTDGILLAELRGDPLLRRYDTIILDEAHERSLNIDFLLGYLTDLLPRRPDLKLIVTSATIDTDRFARHYDAPVVEVSGRSYPVEIRYRPIGEVAPGRADDRDDRTSTVTAVAGERDDDPAPDDPDDDSPGTSTDPGDRPARRAAPAQPRGVDQIDAIRLSVDELRREGPGDILVFLSGQREIHDTARALGEANLPGTEILPLYARLSVAEQQRAFKPHQGRRIVLATNVAETSITVPGVRYVIDTGTARISRFNRRTKLQRLPIEAVSQASAQQRSGRCGRVAPGICIRLYDEDDFAARPEFTEPEILRTNLASVILQLAELGLGDVESFPFIDPPDARAVRDAVALLVELGALSPAELGRKAGKRSKTDDTRSDDDGNRSTLTLTRDGRRMARLPVDPRFGRMLLTAEANGCLREVTVIVAALSIQDPRERPTGEEQQADEMHARFAVPGSDFLAFLALWEHLATEQRARTGNAFRRMCRAEHLNFMRVREWQDLVRQLRQVTHELRLRRNDRAAEPDAIHRSLLAGLLSHIGLWDRGTRDYRGARQARFSVARRSVMSRGSSTWIMAGELIETGRLWASMVARIDPSWVEPLAGHLVKRHHGEPRWSRHRGVAVTDEQVSLYGLPIVAQRTIPLDRIDATEARSMFVDHALVAGDWDDLHRYPFVEANWQVLDEARGLEARARRADLAIGEERLADLYAERLPDDVVSSRTFHRWWKAQDRTSGGPDPLKFTLDDVLGHDADTIDTAGFPLTWTPADRDAADLVLDLSYVFEPGADDDGVTVHVPLVLLPRVTAAGADWHVPCLRLELFTALIRTLPKALRRELSPANERAEEALAGLDPRDGPLLDALAQRLSSLAGTRVRPADLDVARLPRHLQLRFSVEDDDGTVVAAGRDLDVLSRTLAGRARRAVAAAIPGRYERTGLTAWPEGPLPRVVESDVAGRRVVAYPSLIDEGETVGVRIMTNAADQERLMRAATRRLLLLAVPRAAAQAERRLRTGLKRLGRRAPDLPALAADCLTAATDRFLGARGGPAWDEEGYRRLEDAAKDRLAPLAVAAAGQAADIVLAAATLTDRLDQLDGLAKVAPALAPAAADMRSQLARLVDPGFVTATGLTRLPHLARYIEGINLRLAKLRDRPDRDRELMVRVHGVEAAYDDLIAALPPARHADPEVVDARWLLEELRVSLFAQTLGTAQPVSEQRLRRTLAALT